MICNSINSKCIDTPYVLNDENVIDKRQIIESNLKIHLYAANASIKRQKAKRLLNKISK